MTALIPVKCTTKHLRDAINFGIPQVFKTLEDFEGFFEGHINLINLKTQKRIKDKMWYLMFFDYLKISVFLLVNNLSNCGWPRLRKLIYVIYEYIFFCKLMMKGVVILTPNQFYWKLPFILSIVELICSRDTITCKSRKRLVKSCLNADVWNIATNLEQASVGWNFERLLRSWVAC